VLLACADAYLTPCIKRYVSGFASGFKDELKVILMLNKNKVSPISIDTTKINSYASSEGLEIKELCFKLVINSQVPHVYTGIPH